MPSSYNNNTPKIVGAVALGAIIIIGLSTAFIAAKNKDSAQTTNTGTSSQSSQTSSNQSSNNSTSGGTAGTSANSNSNSSSGSSTSSSSKDYSASISYRVPEGHSNTITSKLTIADGKITAVSNTYKNTSRESDMYTQSFNSYISGKVVGKNLSDISLSRVGGASLTTEAFNQVIASIQKDVGN